MSESSPFIPKTGKNRAGGPAAGFKPLRIVLFFAQRWRAWARTRGVFVRLRRAVRYAATAIDQDGILLLMPREPSLSFVWLPLAVLFAAGGAALGALT